MLFRPEARLRSSTLEGRARRIDTTNGQFFQLIVWWHCVLVDDMSLFKGTRDTPHGPYYNIDWNSNLLFKKEEICPSGLRTLLVKTINFSVGRPWASSHSTCTSSSLLKWIRRMTMSLFPNFYSIFKNPSRRLVANFTVPRGSLIGLILRVSRLFWR
jgi:hypothetical protein